MIHLVLIKSCQYLNRIKNPQEAANLVVKKVVNPASALLNAVAHAAQGNNTIALSHAICSAFFFILCLPSPKNTNILPICDID